jgi:acetylornithine deacetylase
MLSVTDLASTLIKIPSVSGQETEVENLLYGEITRLGLDCVRIPVQGQKANNLFAYRGKPKVLLSTHMDVVPAPSQLFSPVVKNNRLIGRGACDAKGLMAAMLCATENLIMANKEGFGVLFVVGEETGGIGARAAAQALLPLGVEWIINGEPTEGKLMRGHKGTLDFTLETFGKACHSGYPERGESAIDKLIVVLSDLISMRLPINSALGPSTINIGKISGGVAENILAPSAQACVLVRTSQPSATILDMISTCVGNRAKILNIAFTDPVALHVLPGFETDVAAYGSDIPNLLPIGAKFLLYGPGSIFEAHTDSESIAIDELESSVGKYGDIVSSLL